MFLEDFNLIKKQHVEGINNELVTSDINQKWILNFFLLLNVVPWTFVNEN